MRTIDTMEHEITASGTEVRNVFNPSSQIFAPFGYGKQFGTFDFENENIVEFNQPLFKNSWIRVGRPFNQPTALGVEALGVEVGGTYSPPHLFVAAASPYPRVEVDSTYRPPIIIRRAENFNLGLPYLKPYPNSIVLDNNSTLLREMLSEIDGLLMNEYDWDEIDYRKPTLEDINCAKDTLIKFVKIIGYADYLLTKPYISNFEEGGASIKWKIGDRTLYLEVGQNISIYTKTWKESGKRCSIEKPLFQRDYIQLWEWVIDADL